jgi:hypothetical protein
MDHRSTLSATSTHICTQSNRRAAPHEPGRTHRRTVRGRATRSAPALGPFVRRPSKDQAPNGSRSDMRRLGKSAPLLPPFSSFASHSVEADRLLKSQHDLIVNCTLAKDRSAPAPKLVGPAGDSYLENLAAQSRRFNLRTPSEHPLPWRRRARPVECHRTSTNLPE